jgi:hypothetical protein
VALSLSAPSAIKRPRAAVQKNSRTANWDLAAESICELAGQLQARTHDLSELCGLPGGPSGGAGLQARLCQTVEGHRDTSLITSGKPASPVGRAGLAAGSTRAYVPALVSCWFV